MPAPATHQPPLPLELWPTDLDGARAVQERLRSRVLPEDRLGPIRRIAAIDAHHSESTGLSWAAVAEVDAATLELTRSVMLCLPTRFPYVPGFLSFREAPAMVAALALLPEPPDLVVVDGQGLAHPRRLGIACHVGVLTGLPTIGIAKSILVGRHGPLGPARGERAPMVHRREVVGMALRTRDGTQPVYVSVGHRVGLDTAVELALRLSPKYRISEPVRLADRISRMHPA
ncbi:MAG TPA: deoxyribonuclease V [Azospirillaceae bacterium]|nr:deoxyribonuclease V [Azospirillaceae bacterium]